MDYEKSKYQDKEARNIWNDYIFGDQIPKNIDSHILHDAWMKSGSPYMKLSSPGEPGFDERAGYTTGKPFKSTVDTLHIPQSADGDIDVDQVIAELAHAYQFNHPELQSAPLDPTGKLSLWWPMLPSIDEDYADSLKHEGLLQHYLDSKSGKHDVRYYIPGMVEHQAHQLIEPRLTKKIYKKY